MATLRSPAELPGSLVARYGAEAPNVIAAASCERPTEPVADGIDVTRAEFEYAVTHEGAMTVDDILDRRTRIGLVASDRESAVTAAEEFCDFGALIRHGLVVAQPRKRPKSATKRFTFSRPNECWQADWTQWQLVDGTAVAIAGSLEDHSRYLTGLSAAAGAGTAQLVWAVMLAGIAECDVPSMSLTDNGFVYTGGCAATSRRSRSTCVRWACTPSTPPRITRRPAARSNGSGRR